MIKRLKRKFIILATVSMLALMTLLVLIMNAVNFTSVVKESNAVLDVLSQSGTLFFDGKTPPERPRGSEKSFIPPGMSPEVPYESRFFTVSVSADGEIKDSDFSQIISVDENEVKDYVEKAVNHRGERGFIGQFRYSKQRVSDDEIRITFLDCGRKLDAFYSFLWTSLAVGFLGCVIVFVAFLFVSGRIVKPISEAYEKQKMFISDAGHEIKTPLTIINANLDLIEDDFPEVEEFSEIRQQTVRLKELTNNLVFLSKMEETEKVIEKSEFRLTDAAIEIARNFIPLAEAQAKEYSFSIQPDVLCVGSESEIRKLLGILLDNAFKYSPGGGSVGLKLRTNRSSAVITVENATVETVKPQTLPLVFERFYRTDSSRNSEMGGHGIGLSIAKAITEAHAGSIRAETSDGNDFRITVILPL